jgi:type II secretory pathway pseudopilin PulG
VHATSHRRGEAGFTLVEVLAAALILAIGVIGAFTLLDTANKTASANNARVGATNLAREISEYARGTDYDLLQPGQVEGALRARTRIAGAGAAGAWTLERRGVTYSINPSVCTFDDPKDGLAATPPANACTPAAAAIAGAPAEINPDDFRRVTIRLSWTDRTGPHATSQNTLVVNPSGGLGPRITDFPAPANQITSGTSVDWTLATNPVKTTPAAVLRWTVDDGIGQGELTGASATDWGFSWDLGTVGTDPFTLDATYLVSAQAFDSRGVPGETRSVNVHVNRRIPYAPANVTAGRNVRHGGVVDLDWLRNRERDVIGYRVWRVDLLGGRTQICEDAGLTYTVKTSCTDETPVNISLGAGLPNYEVAAVDRLDLAATSSVVRDGDKEPISIPLTASTRPDEPTGLSVSIVDGSPVVTWSAPSVDAVAGQRPIRLYRIYRDGGTSLADRYDVTVDASTTWTDPNPGNPATHTYWVTAVDDTNNESNPSASVTYTTP